MSVLDRRGERHHIHCSNFGAIVAALLGRLRSLHSCSIVACQRWPGKCRSQSIRCTGVSVVNEGDWRWRWLRTKSLSPKPRGATSFTYANRYPSGRGDAHAVSVVHLYDIQRGVASPPADLLGRSISAPHWLWCNTCCVRRLDRRHALCTITCSRYCTAVGRNNYSAVPTCCHRFQPC